MQNRFGLCPLYTDSMSNAINNEMLIDSRTGDTALKRSDGKIIQGNDISRLYTHKTEFINRIMCNGLVDSDIYLLDFDNPSISKQVVAGLNILDGQLELTNGKNTTIPKFSISMDLDILESGKNGILISSQIVPTIEICYTANDINKIQQVSYYKLPTETFAVNSMSFELTSIRLLLNPDINTNDVDIILHSILIAYM